jgi:Flp pilus assembly pilin Flp
MIAHFLRDDAGQGLVEYCLVIALVAIVAHSALVVMGRKVNNTLTNAANQLS